MKFKSGGIIKLQNAGVLPRWMQKLNSWSMPESDESAGERIFNSTIKAANNASTQEERDKIYLDSAKRNLAITGQSLMMMPVLNEFAINGLIKGGLRLAGGATASAGGSWLGGKAGNWLNSKLNTTKLDDAGRIIGGIAAFPIGMKAMTKVPVEFGTKMWGQLHNNNIKRQLLNSTYEPFNIELWWDRFNHGLQKTVGRMRPRALDYTLGKKLGGGSEATTFLNDSNPGSVVKQMRKGVIAPQQFSGSLSYETEGAARSAAQQIAKFKNRGVYTVDQIPTTSLTDASGRYNPTFLQQKLLPIESQQELTDKQLRSLIRLSLNSKGYADNTFSNMAFDSKGTAWLFDSPLRSGLKDAKPWILNPDTYKPKSSFTLSDPNKVWKFIK